jgi:hypothetical protein
MNAVVLWERLRESALQSEFEIHTVPQNKFVEGKKISDPDGRIIHMHHESRNTNVPMIVPGENSEADKEEIDGIFPI